MKTIQWKLRRGLNLLPSYELPSLGVSPPRHDVAALPPRRIAPSTPAVSARGVSLCRGAALSNLTAQSSPDIGRRGRPVGGGFTLAASEYRDAEAAFFAFFVSFALDRSRISFRRSRPSLLASRALHLPPGADRCFEDWRQLGESAGQRSSVKPRFRIVWGARERAARAYFDGGGFGAADWLGADGWPHPQIGPDPHCRCFPPTPCSPFPCFRIARGEFPVSAANRVFTFC